MKFFTKSMLTLAMMAFGIATANAEDEKVDLTAAMFYNWNGYGADAASTGAATVDFKVGEALGTGATLAGTSTVDYLIYADITGATKLEFEGTKGMQLRVLMNRQESNSGPLVEKNPVLDDEGKAVLDLTDFTYVHINAIKTGWSSPAGTITSIKIVRPSDPLAMFKTNLSKAIALAKMQNPNFKTSMSWNALQNAISAGEAALAKADVTEGELTDATAAVNGALSGLKLFEGYTKLTASAFKQYESLEAPGEGSAINNAPCVLNEASDLPYGDGSVSELKWADLADYDKLVVITSGDIKPRFCMNRLEAEGQQAATQADSKMIDINPNNEFSWSTERYQTIDGKIFTIDLKKIVADDGFARLHCIKKQGWGTGVVITDLLLFKAPASTTDDPAVAVNLISLQNAIDKANEIDLSTKTRESAKKVKDALAVANDLMAQSAPSLEAIEIARRAILQAIDELVDAPVLADGVYDLTQAMFQEWTGIDEDAEPTEATIGCAYEVGTGEKGAGTTMFGNPSVVWKTYADLSAYDHLLIVGTPGLQLRVLFNRLEVGNGGGDGNGGALTELNPTIGEDGLVDVDLKAEKLNGAARLNAIKLGWGSPAGQFTKLQVVKGAYDPVAVGLQTVKAAAENGAIFNLGGQRLAKPVKGLNIINGKVVVIK